jgi:hypothetical protein
MGDRAMSHETIGFEYYHQYYHQYYSTFDYGVIGGGSGYSQPTISYTQFGLKENAPLGSAGWVDAGSGYSFPTSLKGSRPSERWQENTNESRANIVTSSSTYTVPYYYIVA